MEFQSKCGKKVIVSDQTQKHLEAHPEAMALLEEAIGMVTMPESGGFLLTTIDMGRIVGLNGCLPVVDNGQMYFAFRKGRDVPSHVLVGIEKQPTSLFTVIAGISDDGTSWQLYTSFPGPSAPREPHDPGVIDNNAAEIEFWTQNGLVHDENVMGPAFVSSWADVLGYVRVMRAQKSADKPA